MHLPLPLHFAFVFAFWNRKITLQSGIQEIYAAFRAEKPFSYSFVLAFAFAFVFAFWNRENTLQSGIQEINVAFKA